MKLIHLMALGVQVGIIVSFRKTKFKIKSICV